MKLLFKILFVAGLMVYAPTVLNAASSFKPSLIKPTEAELTRDHLLLGLNRDQVVFRRFLINLANKKNQPELAQKLSDLIPFKFNDHIFVMAAKINDDEFVCIRDTSKVGDTATQWYERHVGPGPAGSGYDAPYLIKISINRFNNECFGNARDCDLLEEYKDCREQLMQSFVPQQTFMTLTEAEQNLASTKPTTSATAAASADESNEEGSAETDLAQKEQEPLAAEQKAEHKANEAAKSWSNNKFTHHYTLIAAGLSISVAAFTKYYYDEYAQYETYKEAAEKDGKKLPSFSTYFWKRLTTTLKISKAVGLAAGCVAGYGVYKGLKA